MPSISGLPKLYPPAPLASSAANPKGPKGSKGTKGPIIARPKSFLALLSPALLQHGSYAPDAAQTLSERRIGCYTMHIVFQLQAHQRVSGNIERQICGYFFGRFFRRLPRSGRNRSGVYRRAIHPALFRLVVGSGYFTRIFSLLLPVTLM